jgi:hypothetical protein
MQFMLMNGRRRRMVVAFAGVLAISGIIASSALAALPEYTSLLKNSFTLTGAEVTLEQSGGITGLHCKKVTGPYELLNVKEFTGKIAFKECSAALAGSCTTPGAAEGEITTNTGIVMRLAYLSKAIHEVGLIINYNYKSPKEALTFATFKCKKFLTEAVVRGPMVAKLTPINESTRDLIVGLAGSGGSQKITQYENESGEKVTASPEMSINEGSFKAADLNAGSLELQGLNAFTIVG